MNRSVAPPINKIISLDTPSLQTKCLINGIPVKTVPNESEEWTSVEIIFEAGTAEEDVHLSAATCAGLIAEGSDKYSAEEIAELKDFYGAKLYTTIGKDLASINLLCLSEHLDKLIPVFLSVVSNPSFPEAEYENYVRRSKASLLVNLERVELIARLEFSKKYFGRSKYAENFSPDDYDRLTVKDVRDFFKNRYGTDKAMILIAGAEVDKAIELMEKQGIPETRTPEKKEFVQFSPIIGLHEVRKEGALQSALRLGKPAITENHPDFVALYVANTLLGGYFGSRLMQNLREDKGFTYGVGSSLQILKDHAALIITTQVGSEHTIRALDEIDLELKRLTDQSISSDELELVINYIAGSISKKLDGTANRASVLKSMVVRGLPRNYYNDFLQSLYSLSSEQVREAAVKYLKSDEFTKIVVGGQLPTTK